MRHLDLCLSFCVLCRGSNSDMEVEGGLSPGHSLGSWWCQSDRQRSFFLQHYSSCQGEGAEEPQEWAEAQGRAQAPWEGVTLWGRMAHSFSMRWGRRPGMKLILDA